MRSLDRRAGLALAALGLSAAVLVAGDACVPIALDPKTPAAALLGAPVRGYVLTWHDEFDAPALDAAKWNVVTGPRRDAINSADAVSVSGGILTITTYTEGGRHYTGFIDTAGKYEPDHGYLEARIRFETSPGEWGAFWLQSPTMGKPVGRPDLAGSEIDIVEHRVLDAKGGGISNSYEMNLHWDGYGESHKHAGSAGRPPAGAPPLQGTWHSYALLWTPSEYVFFLDGVEQWRSREGVSKRGEFIRLTCEALDRGWAGSSPAGGYTDRRASTTRMQVDWVRVWQPRPRPEP
jgi:beta-glucanase (GH16 family)